MWNDALTRDTLTAFVTVASLFTDFNNLNIDLALFTSINGPEILCMPPGGFLDD
jgi:hypothetical protein